MYFDLDFTDIFHSGQINNASVLVQVMVLAPTRRQAITRTNTEQDFWRLMILLGREKLIKMDDICRCIYIYISICAVHMQLLFDNFC